MSQRNYVDANGKEIRYNLHGGAPLHTTGVLSRMVTNIQICSWHYAPQETYAPVLDVKKYGFPTCGVQWFYPSNSINMAKTVASCGADGIIGSSWSIHVPRKEESPGTADRDSGVKNPGQEYEVITMTAEAAWNRNDAEKNISAYDRYELVKKYLWKFVPEEKRTAK